METARAWGVRRSVFLEWPDEDRAWALALHAVERDTCPDCRQPLSETTAADAEGAYTVDSVGGCAGCQVLRHKTKNAEPHQRFRVRRLTRVELARRG